MCKSKHFFLIIISLLCTSQIAQAQIWDGGGDGTSWDDPLNWDGDAVPGTGAFVDFNSSATLTLSGTGTVMAPAQLLVRGATTTVNLDFDLDIGDATSTDPAVLINSGAILTLMAGNTLILDPPTTETAVQMNLGASLIVQETANILVLKAFRGINLNQRLATVTNDGIISISNCQNHAVFLREETGFLNSGSLIIQSPARNGIYNLGGFVNLDGVMEINSPANRGIQCVTAALPNLSTFVNTGSGTILITSPGDDGIRSETAFLNDTDATITVVEATDDGIELIGGEVFTNNGTINISCRAGALASGPGLAVGTNTVAATFINTSNNSLNINAGTSSNGRSIFVYDMGTIQNTGTIDASGGSATLNIFNRGTLANGIGGTINLNDRRLTNGGILTNDGLITSSFPTGPGVFTNSTGNSTNTAFYRYLGISAFSSGTLGTISDSGMDLQDPAQTTIDFGGTCDGVIPITAIYDWINSGNAVGTNNPTGNITANPASIDFLNLTISPDLLPAVILDILNVCAAALPVELLSFTAEPNEKTVMLKWQTASETNNDYIAVERSSDAREFSEIGRRTGAINSQEIRYYQLEDFLPKSGINYYRLRQVDIDGTTTYSDIISVNMIDEGKTELQPSFYPNVVNNSSLIQLDLRSFPAGEQIELEVVDMHGRMWSMAAQAGGSFGEFQLPNLPSGTYLLLASNQPQALPYRFIVLD